LSKILIFRYVSIRGVNQTVSVKNSRQVYGCLFSLVYATKLSMGARSPGLEQFP